MTDKLRAAAEAALEAIQELEHFSTSAVADKLARDAKRDLRAALAEPEHAPDCALLQIPSRDCDCRQEDEEPVAWINIDENGNRLTVQWSDGNKEEVPLYTTPPRRECVSLTDEEIDRVTDAQWARNNDKPIYAAYRAYARAIEAALKDAK